MQSQKSVGQPVHAHDQWDPHVQQLNRKFQEASDHIVHGQHTKEEAEKRQKKLHEIWKGERAAISQLAATQAPSPQAA